MISRILTTLLFLSSIFLTANTLFAQTPPFKQCPAIGADKSCAILITIDANGSLRVKEDPTQGPFDGIEDTLIGVQNNSKNTISSIPLSSTLSIFGFDGDGLCAPSTNPRPAGCPFGPTGYEGPNTFFSGMNANGTAGVVNFTGGIPPGGSAYFSLEERIQTSCSPIMGVPDLKQFSPPWDTDVYDHDPPVDKKTGKLNNIHRWGCYLTGCVDIINYHAAAQGLAFRTTPRDLNNWLNGEKDGYSGGDVSPAAVARYARDNGVHLFYQGRVDHRNDFVLDSFLCNRDPVLLKVPRPKGTHFVTGTGQITVNGTDTYSINDPGHNNTTLEPYGFNYLGIRKFSSTAAPPSGLYVYAHSPVELLVTDPNGNRTGFDSATGQVLTDIPSSGYGSEALGDDDDETSTDTRPEVKEFEVLGPVAGVYTVQVLGTGVGPYSLDFFGYDDNGNPTVITLRGSVIAGSVSTFRVTYSPVPGSSLQVTRIITIADVSAEIQVLLQLGLIDNPGIANSLLQKLRAAQAAIDSGDRETANNVLKALLNEIHAQTGKHIQGDAAQLLASDVALLTN